MKPLFSDKSKAMNTIVLYEKGKIIKNYKRVSEVLNKYFTNLTKSLKYKKKYIEKELFEFICKENQPKLP